VAHQEGEGALYAEDLDSHGRVQCTQPGGRGTVCKGLDTVTGYSDAPGGEGALSARDWIQ